MRAKEEWETWSIVPMYGAWVDAANDTRPAWTRGRSLWYEDECTRDDPDAERLDGAWLRIFGVERPASKLAEWDGGDCFAYLYPGGRVAWHNFDGSQITLAGIVSVTGDRRVDRWHGIDAEDET